jgi:SAM-dependent methyltransferase
MADSNSSVPIDINLLMCPRCRSELLEGDANLTCKGCGTAYRREAGKIFFSEDYFDIDDWASKSTGFDLLRRAPGDYRRIDKIGGPRIRDLPSYLKVDGVALNLGGGADDYEGYVNIDLGRYPNVDIVSSLERIPYKDSSVDLVVSNSVLEHIYAYEAVIGEIHRILRPGGYFYLCVPSVCARHHADDFHRWTVPGLLRLLQAFEPVEHGSCRGVAYVVDILLEGLIVNRTRPGLIREALRRAWLFVSRPLYWIEGDGSPEYEAMSQTIYAIVRKRPEGTRRID